MKSLALDQTNCRDVVFSGVGIALSKDIVYLCALFNKHVLFMKTTKFFAAIIAAFTLFSIVGCTEGSGVSLNDKVVFDITVSDIGSTSATVSVDPNDDTVIYYFDKVTKAAYMTYDSDLEFMKARIAALRVYCEEQGASLVQSLSVGNAEHTYSGELTPSTDYYIFAFAVDAKLNPISDLSLKAFKTDEGKTSNNTFSVKVVDGVITITPSNNDQYFWDVVPSNYYDGQTDEYIIADLIDYYKSEGGLSYYLVSGVDTFDMSEYLTPGESYTVYVFGYEDAPTTGITEYTFTYEGNGGSGSDDPEYGEPSNNTFSVSVNGGTITVTPSNNDQYFWTVEESGFYTGESDSYIISDLVSYYKDSGYFSYYLVSGKDSYDMSEYLTAGKSYTVYVFGYDNGVTTGLTQYTFTYEGTSGGGNTGGDISTPTGDIALNVAGAAAYYYGDLYKNGCNDWDLYLYNDLEILYVEFLTALNSTSPVGTYTIVPYSDNMSAGDALAGEFDDEGYMWPSYYLKYDSSDNLEAYALIASGTVSITKSGSNYTVAVNCKDDSGNKITANYTGAMEVAEGELEENSMSSKSNLRSARKTLRRFSSAASLRPAVKSAKKAHIIRDVKSICAVKNLRGARLAK